MSNPTDCRYTREHEWVRKDGDTYVVGITHYAQDSLGDVVFVELPEVGAAISRGESFGVVESVKAASDLYAPVSGEIVEVNERLRDEPDLVNHHPYEAGWMLRVKASADSSLDDLMDADAYAAFLETVH